MMTKNLTRTALSSVAAALLLAACSPKFDWRDYRSPEAPYAVLFPGKPATQSRQISLEGDKVTMHMAAAEIDGITFAVGSAELPDAERAQAALGAMKTAMVKNLNGTVTLEKQASQAASGGQRTALDIEAKGSRNGETMLLVGRFVAKDKRVYQAIAAGREKHWDKEAVDTFMTSFKVE